MLVMKIKLALYYISTVGLVKIPVGISRNKKGYWTISKVKYPTVNQRRFNDNEHGGSPVDSLYAAIAGLGEREKRQLRKVEEEERHCKVTLTGHVGITYTDCMYRGSRIHRYEVSTPGGDSEKKYVYIAQGDSVKEKLEEAVDLRGGWERERAIKAYWNGLDPQPYIV